MDELLVTFHTHLGAMKLYRRLLEEGRTARLAPVPRVLSSNCGTCLRVKYDGSAADLLTQDAEGVYRVTEGGYTLLRSGE